MASLKPWHCGVWSVLAPGFPAEEASSMCCSGQGQVRWGRELLGFRRVSPINLPLPVCSLQWGLQHGAAGHWQGRGMGLPKSSFPSLHPHPERGVMGKPAAGCGELRSTAASTPAITECN